MNSNDYPALHRDAEDASTDAQSKFFRALAASLICLLIAALLSLADNRTAEIAIIQALTIVASLSLTIYMAWVRPQRNWYGARALAESVKTVTWRYMVKAEPFNKPDQLALELFGNSLQNIFKDNTTSVHIIAKSEGSQITHFMNQVREKSLTERKDTYDKFRIKDQLTWYKNKAKFNKSRSNFWFSVSIIAHLLALSCAICKVAWPSWEFWPTDVFITAAGGAMAWLQTKRHQELSGSYSLAAHEISLVQSRLGNIKTEVDFSDFVGDAENAFSREHTQWRARLDIA